MSIHQIKAYPTAIPGVQAVTAHSTRGFARHTHDQFGIGLVDFGAQTSASGRGPVEVMAGDLITVNPGEVHDGRPVDDHGRSWRMLYLDPDAMLRLTGSPHDFAYPVLRHTGLATAFHHLFTALRQAPSKLATEETLMILRKALDDRPSHARKPANVARAVQALQDDPARPVTLADMSHQAGLSRFHFLRSFAKATGLTPHAFQVQARLHLARRMILSGQPLAAAATGAGFADQSHLTRLFQRSYGMTPGSYARNFVQDRGPGIGQ
jgi:AraC-like DNA-binding protein